MANDTTAGMRFTVNNGSLRGFIHHFLRGVPSEFTRVLLVPSSAFAPILLVLVRYHLPRSLRVHVPRSTSESAPVATFFYISFSHPKETNFKYRFFVRE